MQTHWLSAELGHVRSLAGAFAAAREADDGGSKAARERYLSALNTLVEQIAAHPGVTSAFCAHQGLPLAAAGEAAEAELLAAMAEWCLVPAVGAARSLELGELRQMVISGERRKLALLQVGEISLGVLCPSEVNLAALLAEGRGGA